MRFTPGAIGARDGTLDVLSDANDGTFRVDLVGTGEAAEPPAPGPTVTTTVTTEAPPATTVMVAPPAPPPPAAAAGPAFSGFTAARRGKRVRVRLTVLPPGAGATVALRLRAGRATVGALTRRAVKAGRLTLDVKLSRTGRAALRRKGRLKLAVRLTVTPPGGKAAVASRTVTLRR